MEMRSNGLEFNSVIAMWLMLITKLLIVLESSSSEVLVDALDDVGHVLYPPPVVDQVVHAAQEVLRAEAVRPETRNGMKNIDQQIQGTLVFSGFFFRIQPT